MKVFVAGATGVLGLRLVHRFVEAGHGVTGVARDEDGAHRIRSLGGEATTVDLFDVGSLVDAARGSDVVIHAASAVPDEERPAMRDYAADDRLRREGTRCLSLCAARVGASSYLQLSTVAVARPPDGSRFDEETPPNGLAANQSALDAERIAWSGGERFGHEVGLLRCGWLYGPDSPWIMGIGDDLMERRVPVIGEGDALWALVHVRDAAGAFLAAAEAGRSGLWHVVDDEPVEMGEFLDAFARRLRAPRPRRMPRWLARLLVGRRGVRFADYSTHTSNERIRRELGWSPRFRTHRQGLDQIVTTWFSHGYLLRSREPVVDVGDLSTPSHPRTADA